MGAEASSLQAAAANTSRRTRKAIVQKWQRRQQPGQLFSIVRHAERADGIYAFHNGQRWTTTEDFTQWPVDPPLSDAGLVASEDIGQNLAKYAAGLNTQFHVVISSPYYRCVQTAVKICKSLGPGARLLLDRSLGEVYGPSVMGHAEPLMPVRGIRQTLDYCRANGVILQEKAIGTWPAWPEELKTARQRYALRFLAYLRRSAVTRRNFVLVGHADCVGSVLATMPSQMNEVVERVEYGGYLVAKRRRPEWSNPKGFALGGRGPPAFSNFSSVAPVLNDIKEGAQARAQGWLDFGDLEEAGTLQELHPAVQRVASWGQEGSTALSNLQRVKEPGAWKVKLQDISTRPRQGSGRFRKHLRALVAEGKLTTAVLEELLGELGTLPLIADEEMQPSVQIPSTSAAEAPPSFCSLSTYLFGASASELGAYPEDGAASGSSRLNTDNSMSGRSDSDTEVKPLAAVAASAVQVLERTPPAKSAPCRGWQDPSPQHSAVTLHSVLEHSGDEEEHNPAPRKYRTCIGSLPKMLASGCSTSPPQTPTLLPASAVPPSPTPGSNEFAAGQRLVAAALEPPPVVFKSLEGSKLLQRRRNGAGPGARP